VRPDYVVEVRADVRQDRDGPMLRHGLQEMDGRQIVVPRAPKERPDPDRLDRRYQEFRSAG
jgi:putative restriction endonuclease